MSKELVRIRNPFLVRKSLSTTPVDEIEAGPPVHVGNGGPMAVCLFVEKIVLFASDGSVPTPFGKVAIMNCLCSFVATVRIVTKAITFTPFVFLPLYQCLVTGALKIER